MTFCVVSPFGQLSLDWLWGRLRLNGEREGGGGAPKTSSAEERQSIAAMESCLDLDDVADVVGAAAATGMFSLLLMLREREMLLAIQRRWRLAMIERI